MIDAAIRSEILRRLAAIEQAEEVQILYACESGSRAWGFDSPDSDYDVRFLYVRQRDWYISVRPGRDVIEAPIDPELELDINGWDIKKALWLLRKSNPVLIEWFNSPVKYICRPELLQPLFELIEVSHNPLASCHHYLSIASHQNNILVSADGLVRRKKYLYILRGLLAADWSQQRSTPPPMQFSELIAESSIKPEVIAAIDSLLEEKRSGSELISGERITVLDEFIEDVSTSIETDLPLPKEPAGLPIYDRALRRTLELAWG